MNSTNNDFCINAALKVFAQLGQLIEQDENKPKQINVLDSSTVIFKDDKPFKFDLSIMPDDVVSCIGKHLEDYPFEIYKDTELYKLFFKHDKPDDYKEYIQYITDIKDNKTHKQYDFTESCKTDLNIFLPNIKKYFKELKIKTYEIKFKHEKILKIPYVSIPEIKITPIIYFYDKNKFNCLIIYETYIDIINKVVENDFQKRSREFRWFRVNRKRN
jgi:hypothetical protein